LLLLIFIGMGTTVLKVVQGVAPADVRYSPYRDSLLTAAPMVILMPIVLILGLSIPGPLTAMLNDATAFLEGRQ
jgi:formate hydrogenlyase subunit 3/multisubunit Na+/H+ antiporter MnhD subunit